MAKKQPSKSNDARGALDRAKLSIDDALRNLPAPNSDMSAEEDVVQKVHEAEGYIQQAVADLGGRPCGGGKPC